VATRTRWRRAPSQAVPTSASAAPAIAVRRSASFEDPADDETSALLVCTGACAARSPARLAWARLSPSWLASCADAAPGTSADSSWTPLVLDVAGGVAGVVVVPAAGALLDEEPVTPVCAGDAAFGSGAPPVEAPPAGGTAVAPPPDTVSSELVVVGPEVDGAAGAVNAQVGGAAGGWDEVQAGDGPRQGVLLDGAGGVVSRPGGLDDGAPPEPSDPGEGCDVVGTGWEVVGAEGCDVVGTGWEVVGAEGCEVVGEGDAAGLVLGGALVGEVVGAVVVGSAVVSAGVGSGDLVDGGGSSALGVVPLGVVPLDVAGSSGRASGELLDAALLVVASEALTEEVACGSSAWAASGAPSTPRAASPTAPRARALRAAEGVTGGVQGRRSWRCPVGVVVGADPRRGGAAGGRRPLMLPDASRFVKPGTVTR